MKKITYAGAIAEALAEEMRRDDRVIVLGEDIGIMGGMWGQTKGLYEEFGPQRVLDTPISEAAIVGCALGAAITGLRPVAEIMFGDFITLAMDQIINQVAKIHYMSGGKLKAPLVIRSNIGAGRRSAAQHSQSLHAWFVHTPGLKVVVPSGPYEAKGLLKAAIRDDDPIVVFEQKRYYRKEGEIPEEEYIIPIGKAEIKREGNDVTVIAISHMVQEALLAAEKLEREGIDVEVIDPRTLVPLDTKTIIDSVKKTNKVIIADEGPIRAGLGSELVALIVQEAFDYLDVPPIRVGNTNTPIPFSPPLEDFVVPNTETVYQAVCKILSKS